MTNPVLPLTADEEAVVRTMWLDDYSEWHLTHTEMQPLGDCSECDWMRVWKTLDAEREKAEANIIYWQGVRDTLVANNDKLREALRDVLSWALEPMMEVKSEIISIAREALGDTK